MKLLWLSLLLFGMFTLSMLASYFQHRYYLRVVNDLARQFHRSGFALASGRCKGKSRGAIAILVVRRDDPDVIERAMIMQGRTVFARFRERPELAGRASEATLAACSTTVRRAVDDALQRGHRVAAGQQPGPAVGAERTDPQRPGPQKRESALSRSLAK